MRTFGRKILALFSLFTLVTSCGKVGYYGDSIVYQNIDRTIWVSSNVWGSQIDVDVQFQHNTETIQCYRIGLEVRKISDFSQIAYNSFSYPVSNPSVTQTIRTRIQASYNIYPYPNSFDLQKRLSIKWYEDKDCNKNYQGTYDRYF
jgi:hypothetical protein